MRCKDTKKYQYIIVPLQIIQRIHQKGVKGVLETALYGVYMSAMAIETGGVLGNNAIRQVIYCYYRGELPTTLREILDSLAENGKLHLDDSREGFSADGSEFEAYDEIDSLVRCCEELPDLKQACEEFHKVRQVLEMFGWWGFTPQEVIEAHGRLSVAENNVPLASVRTDIISTFLRAKENERVLLALYMGIRSILGKDKIYFTTSDEIKCRMLGAKNDMELDMLLTDERIADIYERYCTRKKYDGMMNELERRGLAKREKFGRFTVITTSLNDEAFLLEIAKAAKQRGKRKQDSMKVRSKARKAMLSQLLVNVKTD